MKRILSVLCLLLLIPQIALGAVAVSHPTSAVASTSNTTSYALGAYTPTANALQVVLVYATDTTAAATMSDSGNGYTWTRQNTYSATHSVYIFTAQAGASPASMTVTFDCTGDAATGAVIEAFEVTGHSTSTPVRQSKGNDSNTANPAVTFDSAALTASAVIGIVGVNRANAAYTAPTSWTEQSDNVGYATPNAGIESAYRATGETGTTMTWTGSAGNWIGMIIEINDAGVATGNVLNNNNVDASGQAGGGNAVYQ